MPEQHAPTPEGMQAILDLETAADALVTYEGQMTAMGVMMSLIFRRLLMCHQAALEATGKDLGKDPEQVLKDMMGRYGDILN